jgi:hypothetical protein
MTIEDAASKFHWFIIGEDGVVEMYLDHHSLATFRSCEASFELLMMANVKSSRRSWNLEFGIIFHEMVELFYEGKKAGTFKFDDWLQKACALWDERDMHEQFSEHKMYKVLGGLSGFIAMMGQYANHFAAEVDRLRVIGIEITFGKKKEVPLGEFYTWDVTPSVQPHYSLEFDVQNIPVRCYLTGRIDFLMDNGSAIGPLDHKTTAFFKGDPTSSYDPQEGMTGYVFATRAIMQKQFPELLQNRKVDRIWMNFAQVTPQEDALKRFKRVPVFKTDWQLEQYRLRQLRTFHKIYDMLILGEQPDWNTAVCNNMFHSECQFRNLHRQNSASSMLQILKSDFVIAPAWNPEKLND